MADPREVEWQCNGKSKIPSRKRAILAARRASDAHGGRIVPYLCKHCHFYHIGNQLKQKGFGDD